MWTLTFPKTQEADAYTGLEDWPAVCEQVKSELRQSIEDLGSDGYSPDDFVPVGYNSDNDTDGEQWQEAVTKAIDHEVRVRFPRIESLLSTVREARLPDGTWIAVSNEEEQDAA